MFCRPVVPVVVAPRITALRPDLIQLPSGPNDLLAAAPDYTEIAQDLRRLYTLASDTGARITAFTLARAVVKAPAATLSTAREGIA